MGEIRIKRVYNSPAAADGCRVLVDRLWPRGVSRDRAGLDGWLKDVAPSPQLRTLRGHDPARLGEFTRRYWSELRSLLHEHARVTLVYAARDPAVNHAVALRDYLSPHGGRKE
jgi:uncharacterized protein YeaO (DUF488 family)